MKFTKEFFHGFIKVLILDEVKNKILEKYKLIWSYIMNQSEYPNRDALRQANDIYLDAMRAFIIHHLKQIRGEKVENLIEDVLYDNQVNQFRQMLDKHKDIGLAIDFTYIPHIIKEYWKDDFADKFEDNLVAQNMLWLIRNGRNECEHRGHDLDPEFTRTHLFIIAELLGKINRSDKQKEVLVIRDQFLTDNAAKQISEMTEQLETEKTDKKKYKRDFEKIQRQLEDLENQHETDKQDLEKLELQLKEADTQKKTIEENLTNIEDDLKTAEDNLKAAEDAWIESDKNLKSKMVEIQNIENEKKRIEGQYELLKKQFEGVQKENQKYKENLASIENQLSDAKTEKRNTEERLSTLVNPVFPPLDNDLNVYILDRRETDRKKYIISLLETKRPSIIYVDSEEKIEVFFEYIAGEKADAIGRHSEYSSDTAEKELLEKLENGDLIALVSNATFTTIPDQHVIEHFVFCHPILDFDEFCQQCHLLSCQFITLICILYTIPRKNLKLIAMN